MYNYIISCILSLLSATLSYQVSSSFLWLSVWEPHHLYYVSISLCQLFSLSSCALASTSSRLFHCEPTWVCAQGQYCVCLRALVIREFKLPDKGFRVLELTLSGHLTGFKWLLFLFTETSTSSTPHWACTLTVQGWGVNTCLTFSYSMFGLFVIGFTGILSERVH